MSDKQIFYKDVLIEDLGVEQLCECIHELVEIMELDMECLLKHKQTIAKLRHGASYGHMRVGLKISEIGKNGKEPESDVPTDV